jgi:hypothetical protein
MPELGELGVQERKSLLAQANAKSVQSHLLAYSSVFSALPAAAAFYATGDASQAWVSIPSAIVAFVLVWVIVYQYQLIRIRAAARLEIMKLLKGRRLPVCLRCGYDLTAIESDRCPECAAPIRVPN